MQKNLILLVCLIIITAMNSSWGREPAVDPVKTIAVEEYDAPKENVKGYDFTKANSREINSTQSPTGLPVKESEQADTMSTGKGTLLFFLIAILPFAFWFGLMFGTKVKNQDIAQEKKEDDKIDSDDDHWDLPKAS